MQIIIPQLTSYFLPLYCNRAGTHTHTHTNEHKDFIAQVHSSHVPCMRAMTQARIKCNIRKKSCTLALTDTHSHSSAFRHTRARAGKLPDLLVRGGGDAGVAVPPAHQPAEGRGGRVVVRGRLPQVPT